ncbi:MAG: Crp/Fnr family transcriptional regulator [Peptostreptococcaceae bacterium]
MDKLLSFISEDNIDYVISNSVIKKYKKSAIIYFKDDICLSYDIILNGKISVEDIDKDGNIDKLCEFMKGDVLGDVLIFSSENKYPMNIVVSKNCEILHIKKEILLDLCQKDIYFLERFLSSLSNKAVVLKNKIKLLSSKNLREKIINFLIKEENIQNTNIISLNRTKTELANYFGVQRSSLSRELKNMKDEGLIDFDLKTISIINI